MNDFHERLDRALSIMESAARVSLHYFRGSVSVETKEDLSPVTIADKETESAIRFGLAQHFPGEKIFGEEFGFSGEGEEFWVVDPIDGTRSFLTGLPLFGMLLGFVDSQGPALGAIQMPALKEMYAGARGAGATCNGKPIHASDCKFLDQARLYINEGNKIACDEPTAHTRLIRSGMLQRMGSDCYPHALLARGFVDVVVDYDLQPYDYLPILPVVEAAGGVMADWKGDKLSMSSDGRTITAATPELLDQMVELLNND